MSLEVHGPFASVDDAVITVNGLQLKGLMAKNITMFANNSNTLKLQDRTVVNVETDLTDDESDDSFMDKIKKLFVHDEDDKPDIHAKLVSMGISEVKAAKYEDAIESGKILVVADNTLKLGHDQFFDNENEGKLSVNRDIY